MSNVFISWYDGQNHLAANEFFRLLKIHGFGLEHSPYSPQSGIYDKRWVNWYSDGLPKAMDRAEIFIAVITPACDGSTWMIQEFEEAYLRFLKMGKPALYFIRFDPAEQQVKYPAEYLLSSIRLSSIPQEAVRTLMDSSS